MKATLWPQERRPLPPQPWGQGAQRRPQLCPGRPALWQMGHPLRGIEATPCPGPAAFCFGCTQYRGRLMTGTRVRAPGQCPDSSPRQPDLPDPVTEALGPLRVPPLGIRSKSGSAQSQTMHGPPRDSRSGAATTPGSSG